ncbi:tyrosine-type recombinase/integrase [Leifsonia sp. 22587]|uniref:tyrosine-type recombinase/integrase n=1 Tax=Leifsonia sp. 22587 TaxID=3453946 RepID=UPI003F86FD39
MGLHTLRHSAASTMLAAGVPLKVVSDILGHSSVAITGDIYGHVSPEVSASAMDQLSAALG